MRRTPPLIVAVLTVVAVAVVSACGAADPARDTAATETEAPAARDLAADALAALADAESAHYVLDATLELERLKGTSDPRPVPEDPIKLHVEGDASSERATADIRFTFDENTTAARLLADRTSVFVEFMGVWYGKTNLHFEEDAAEREIFAPERVREYFDDVFAGRVVEGPEIDGHRTWQFEGGVNVDGLIRLVERYQGDLHETSRDQLEAFGHVTELRFVVGKDDRLLRRFEMDVNLTRNAALHSDEDPPVGALELHVALALSEFGTEVAFERPARYEPFEKLFDQLFGALG